VTFPKNAWYVACSANEIEGRLLGRRVCDEPMVFFLGPDGSVAGLEDWCPHRGAPLSLGQLCDGHLTCGYHGLGTAATDFLTISPWTDGRCVDSHHRAT
jgi:vanillate monooxygenase